MLDATWGRITGRGRPDTRDRHWGSDTYLAGGHPFLTRAAAEWLRDAGAAVVGIDGLNIDAIDDMERPVHTVLLGAGIPIVEHLTAPQRDPCVLWKSRGRARRRSRSRSYAVPPPTAGWARFPVRGVRDKRPPG